MTSPSPGFKCAFVCACAIMIFLVAPIFVVFPVSLTPERYLSLPTDGISFRHYLALWENPVWLGSFGRSLMVAISSTCLTLLLGVPFSIACWKFGSRWSGLLIGIALLPLMVPGIVSGVAFFNAWAALGLLDTYAGVIIANVILAFPFVAISCSISLANFDRRLEQAARNLGAGPLRATVSVIVPNMLPGILSGAIFAFITAWDEIVVLLFIASRNVYLLPRALWDGINDNVDPSIAAVSSLLTMVTVLALAWTAHRARRAAQRNAEGAHRAE